MIKRLTVARLFDTYDYTLCFGESSFPTTFISGPNGYGKTTILTLADAVINQKTNVLLNPYLDFSKLEVTLDALTIVINRSKTNRAPSDQDEPEYFVELTVDILDSNDNSSKESCTITSDDGVNNRASFPANTSLYLRSLSCQFIRDNRLFAGNETSETNIMKIFGEISDRMREFERDTNYAIDYVRSMSVRSESKIQNQSVSAEKAEYTKYLLSRYHKVGLLTSWVIDNVSSNDSHFLALSSALEETSFLLQMEAFKKWIDESCFSHKTLVLDIVNGAYFETDNNSPILPMNLSSGEKQMYLQAYKLTLGASEGSIVLIDEPEISYHPAWLTDYLEHITLAAKSRNLQIILATHSMAIFGYDLSKCIDLYTLAHENNDATEEHI